MIDNGIPPSDPKPKKLLTTSSFIRIKVSSLFLL
jgi:hypothetical protein